MDKLVSAKLFSSRNEAVRESVRRLIAQYTQIAEFKWYIFGPRSRDEMRKIVESSEDVEGVRVSRETMDALEGLI